MIFSLKTLAGRINKFDTCYEMSDDPKIFKSGNEEETKISHWLNGLTNIELNEVISNLNTSGWINYSMYFKQK